MQADTRVGQIWKTSHVNQKIWISAVVQIVHGDSVLSEFPLPADERDGQDGDALGLANIRCFKKT